MKSEDGPSLRAAGFQLGDTLITGSDRREWIRAKESRDKERNTVVSSIMLLARPYSPLYLVLLETSRRNKDPNILIEATEKLFNAPCMATCLSIVSLENKKITELHHGKLSSLPASKSNRQIGRESMIQFLNVFSDDQKESPTDMVKILKLKNFCSQG